MYEVTYVKTENDKPSRLLESVNSIRRTYYIYLFIIRHTFYNIFFYFGVVTTNPIGK